MSFIMTREMHFPITFASRIDNLTNIYIYIYRERERDRYTHTHSYVYIYICTYACICLYIYIYIYILIVLLIIVIVLIIITTTTVIMTRNIYFPSTLASFCPLITIISSLGIHYRREQCEGGAVDAGSSI